MKLKSLFIDVTTRPAEIVTVPEVKQVDISEIFSYLNNQIKSK
jgi:hypothetical protein